MSIATLEWFERRLGAMAAQRLDLDSLGGFQQICLHEILFLSNPSARYTDKVDGPRRAG
jgi:hypothetical protein